ncbi:MAG TPA: phosphate ABC transporter permease PstA [Phycisphaerales bacterium]|nr:phosphate ABC transporter permease PstA [Phycisphaerales bacterium]
MIRSERLRRGASSLMYAVCVTFALSIIIILAFITAYLVSIGFSSLTTEFFTEIPTGDINNPGGMKHAILGTLTLLGMASVVGIPLGVLVGVYLSEYAADRWLPGPVRFIADVLAGVPSIVVGILGYELIVVPMGRFSGYAGAFALAFIMIPIVARTTEEMLRLVPHSYREASMGLGATKSQTILRVILPSATGSIVTGVMLAMARIAGETAPLLFTALGSRLMPDDAGQPFPSLTVQIYTYAVGPYEAQRKLAWAGMLVLIAILFLLNLLIRFLTSRSIRRA